MKRSSRARKQKRSANQFLPDVADSSDLLRANVSLDFRDFFTRLRGLPIHVFSVLLFFMAVYEVLCKKRVT